MRILHRCALALPLFVLTAAAHSQGCAQCRDNLQSTSPATQAAYRHAIELMAVTGIAFFTGGVLVLRRYR